MIARGVARWAPAILAIALLAPAALSAQISPGALSRAHAALEGNHYCLSCHSSGKGVDPQLCLACHRALGARIAEGKGLHAGPDYRTCERCHPDHGGREFALVEWTGRREAFDHTRTGWALEGRHAKIACAECHKPERVAPAVRELEPGIDPSRTFLGLSAACTACHADPHRGSLAPASCTDCHSQESWKSPRGFDHAKTRYPLTGKHAKAPCLDCHRQRDAAAKTLVFDQFRAAGSPACVECHRDPHAGKLGSACASCHGTTSFRGTPAGTLDHDRTAYPLHGKHRAVECAKCHAPGRELRIPGYERCETCHRDPHLGQLRTAAVGGACATCHDIERFSPARFGFEEHAKSRYPLAGAHRAVPCMRCHAQVETRRLPAPYGAPGPARVIQYRFTASACADCHRDLHAGTLDRFAAGSGCKACHDENDWRRATFDHARTRFPLTGAHARPACDRCHVRKPEPPLRFDGLPLDCAGCHPDVHAGQFAVAKVTACERCHGIESFKPTPGFDHAKTRFPLTGRHAGVPCALCHPAEKANETPVARYTGRPLDCAGCHKPKAGGRP